MAFLVVIGGGLLTWQHWSNGTAFNPQTGRTFGLIVGIEFTLAGLGAGVLAALGKPQLVAPWVVGVPLLRSTALWGRRAGQYRRPGCSAAGTGTNRHRERCHGHRDGPYSVGRCALLARDCFIPLNEGTQMLMIKNFKESMMSEQPEKKAEDYGSRMAVGIAVGIAIGAGIGVAMDNMAMGIAAGIAIGAGMGAAMGGKRQQDKGN